MKIIFLDFDGVLNSATFIRNNKSLIQPSKGLEGYVAMFDPAAVARLNKIVEVTGAKIVFSTSWRLMLPQDQLVKLMEMVGVKADIVDQTPINLDFSMETYGMVQYRWQEIEAWLKSAVDVENFVILEDSEDMAPFAKNAVMTDHKAGLTDAKMLEAIEVLGVKNESI